MGLDMYLEKEHSYYGGDPKAAQIRDIVGGPNIGTIIVRSEFLYWRKFQALHQWFVNNVQDGVDNCASYWVDKDKLIELRDTLQKITKDKSLAPILLSDPYHESYDDYYWEDVADTLKALEDEKLEEQKDYDYTYNSSW